MVVGLKHMINGKFLAILIGMKQKMAIAREVVWRSDMLLG